MLICCACFRFQSREESSKTEGTGLGALDIEDLDRQVFQSKLSSEPVTGYRSLKRSYR